MLTVIFDFKIYYYQNDTTFNLTFKWATVRVVCGVDLTGNKYSKSN